MGIYVYIFMYPHMLYVCNGNGNRNTEEGGCEETRRQDRHAIWGLREATGRQESSSQNKHFPSTFRGMYSIWPPALRFLTSPRINDFWKTPSLWCFFSLTNQALSSYNPCLSISFSDLYISYLWIFFFLSRCKIIDHIYFNFYLYIFLINLHHFPLPLSSFLFLPQTPSVSPTFIWTASFSLLFLCVCVCVQVFTNI